MPSNKTLQYEHTDLEVNEVAKAALDYIRVGDELNKPFDLRGLCVYGVINTLRNVYEQALDKLQQQRVIEVEAIVDVAVASDMQYYPFGHKDTAKLEIDYGDDGDRDDRQRGLSGRGNAWVQRGPAEKQQRYVRRKHIADTTSLDNTGD